MLILASEKLPYSTWDGKNPPAPPSRQPAISELDPKEEAAWESLQNEVQEALERLGPEAAPSTNQQVHPNKAA